MGRIIVSGICLLLLTACSHTVFIVRHAEKEVPGGAMSSDVPLSAKGAARAIALKERLQKEHIGAIYTTNTQRTRNTAQPTADLFQLQLQLYGPAPDSPFIALLRQSKKNLLVVGHSNTVDDIVNLLAKKQLVSGDLPDSAYSNLFIIKMKGKKIKFTRELY